MRRDNGCVFTRIRRESCEPWCRITRTHEIVVSLPRDKVYHAAWGELVYIHGRVLRGQGRRRQGPPRRVRGSLGDRVGIYGRPRAFGIPDSCKLALPARRVVRIEKFIANDLEANRRSCPEGPARGFSIISVSAVESTAIHASSGRPAIRDRFQQTRHVLSEEASLLFAKVRPRILSLFCVKFFSSNLLNLFFFFLIYSISLVRFFSPCQRRALMFFPSARSATGFSQAINCSQIFVSFYELLLFS